VTVPSGVPRNASNQFLRATTLRTGIERRGQPKTVGVLAKVGITRSRATPQHFGVYDQMDEVSGQRASDPKKTTLFKMVCGLRDVFAKLRRAGGANPWWTASGHVYGATIYRHDQRVIGNDCQLLRGLDAQRGPGGFISKPPARD